MMMMMMMIVQISRESGVQAVKNMPVLNAETFRDLETRISIK